jgi:hypothetical protein
MKLTKSKQFLADAIHASGKGWPDGANWACQHKRMKRVVFTMSAIKPHVLIEHNGWAVDGGCFFSGFKHDKLSPNWRQTVLSREEHFSAYPAEPVTDADGWIVWKSKFYGDMPVSEGAEVDILMDGKIYHRYVAECWKHWGTTTKYRLYDANRPRVIARNESPEQRAKLAEIYRPSIEQLAADYRNAKGCAERLQQEADDAREEADAKLVLLVDAGKTLGLDVSPITAKQGTELVITDWRDLQVGGIIQCVGSWEKEKTDGMQLTVTALESDCYEGNLPIRVEVPGVSCPGTWGSNFKFIRLP